MTKHEALVAGDTQEEEGHLSNMEEGTSEQITSRPKILLCSVVVAYAVAVFVSLYPIAFFHPCVTAPLPYGSLTMPISLISGAAAWIISVFAYLRVSKSFAVLVLLSVLLTVFWFYSFTGLYNCPSIISSP